MNRISREELIVAATKLVSKRGTCLRARVGAVIEREGRILSWGYNGSPPTEPHCEDVGCLMENGHCMRTTHAEANAIAWAARQGIKIEGATIWVYGWITGGDLGICQVCHKLARSAGIVDTKIIPFDRVSYDPQPYGGGHGEGSGD